MIARVAPQALKRIQEKGVYRSAEALRHPNAKGAYRSAGSVPPYKTQAVNAPYLRSGWDKSRKLILAFRMKGSWRFSDMVRFCVEDRRSFGRLEILGGRECETVDGYQVL
jgi:hypothetical protein